MGTYANDALFRSEYLYTCRLAQAFDEYVKPRSACDRDDDCTFVAGECRIHSAAVNKAYAARAVEPSRASRRVSRVVESIMDLLGREDFIRALENSFPGVAADIDAEIEAGLLHLEMGVLRRFAQAAIDSRNEAEVRRHFAFADDLFRRAGPELKNALYVSYLEHLDFGGDRAYAEALLPPALHAGWIEINEYLDALFAEGQKLVAKQNGPR